jgi:hypothetical protein
VAAAQPFDIRVVTGDTDNPANTIAGLNEARSAARSAQRATTRMRALQALASSCANRFARSFSRAQGLKTMRSGGLRRLYIPGALGFPNGLPSGPGRPRVPPLSPLIFDVKLLYIPGLE